MGRPLQCPLRVGPEQVSKHVCLCVSQNKPTPFPGWISKRWPNPGLVVALHFSVSVGQVMFLCYSLVSGCMFVSFVTFLLLIACEDSSLKWPVRRVGLTHLLTYLLTCNARYSYKHWNRWPTDDISWSRLPSSHPSGKGTTTSIPHSFDHPLA